MYALLELGAGNLEVGLQTVALFHSSFAEINFPEANKVAAMLAGLGTGLGTIDVSKSVQPIDLIKDEFTAYEIYALG
jgi:hypothetical protein